MRFVGLQSSYASSMLGFLHIPQICSAPHIWGDSQPAYGGRRIPIVQLYIQIVYSDLEKNAITIDEFNQILSAQFLAVCSTVKHFQS